jgi:uncharacterized phiE125 gp8 family phage protein
MNWHLSVVTPPSIEPVTLEEAIGQCHANSGVEDDWFRRAITTARLQAEMYQRRAYINQTLQLSFDTWPKLPIYFPRSPVSEILSVKAYDIENTETVISISNFLIDYSTSPARLTLMYGYQWPDISLRDINSIQIQYTAGYGDSRSDIPPDVKQAILLYVDYLYENRAGETKVVPKQFYHKLAPQRLYL